jgi:hypothetical protein
MSGIRPTQDPQEQFFNSRNEALLDRLLYSDFQRRTGGDLSDKQKERLLKTVRHYMGQVYAAHPDQPVQKLNTEVLQAVVPDYLSYLRRNAGPTMAQDDDVTMMRQDVNSRFERIQSERQEGRSTAPPEPNFRIPLDDEASVNPLNRFEEIKKQREAEAARDAERAAAITATGVGTAGGVMSTEIVRSAMPESSNGEFLDSEMIFRNGAAAAKRRDEEALAARTAQRLAGRGTMQQMPEPPDPRRLLFGEGAIVPLPPRGSGLGQTNPTLALPESYRDRPVLPQDNLKPQDDVISYRENEYNLCIYSADRDWVRNSTENRYNFSVSFDPANNRPGFGFSPATNIKFKNITRIEFIKAIMPVEACDIQVQSTADGATATNTSLTTGNVFAYPYLQVRIPELNVNTYGTNDGINNSFAVISYDAYWSSDSSSSVNKGYARMIPKFLKCQKVFYPTPLATLNKLTFEIQRPDGNLVCDSLDTLDVSGFVMSSDVKNTSNNYYNAGDPFIWIQTKSYFNRFAFGSGDRLQFKNVDFTSAWKAAAGGQASQAFIDFITRPEGHLILDIGNGATAATVAVGANAVGYGNWLIIRNKYNNPATGSTSVYAWGSTFTDQLVASPNPSSGRLINLNHQVQIIMRVITRDMDAASRLRPDNLQA